MDQKQKFPIFSLPELIFISSMAVLNVVFDLFLSPILILALGHIIAGILIMVPLNFLFISLTKHLVQKFGVLTVYMLVFSLISIPTTFFGGIPGVYKILVGLIIGILLDLSYSIKKPVFLRITIGGLFGALFWWTGAFIIWTLFDFPFVTGMSILVDKLVGLNRIITIPVTQINGDFFIFTLICGALSSIQCLILTSITYPVAQTIKKTAIYEKFTTYA